MYKSFFVVLLFVLSVFADSVTLYNDSAFSLMAIIRGANGKKLGEQAFEPGEQSTWDTSQDSTQLDINYDTTSSYTPYVVEWRCSEGGVFSICYNVPAGGTVSATNCSGPGYCNPKKDTDTGSDTDQQTSCRNCLSNKIMLK